jgi:hypothetical protein
MIKTALTNSLPTTSPIHRKIRVRERQRMTLGSGATSTKSPGTTPMNVAQNIHCWLRSKTRIRTLIHNLIKKIMKKIEIIDIDPTATVATTTIQPADLEEGEFLFHSQMWVKGTSLHFIVDSGRQNNLILAEVVK